jgi:RNA polymerase sigma factor (sigma-70 family)
MAEPESFTANPQVRLQDLEALHTQAYGWALSRCRRSRADAADLLQSAYAVLLDGSARFDGRSTLRTFLFGVIDRIARAQRRRERLRRLLLGKFQHELVNTESPGADSRMGDDEQAQLRAALQALSPRQRDVLELVFYRDCSIEDAAAIMGVPIGTARTHYQRGKQALAGKLAVSL